MIDRRIIPIKVGTIRHYRDHFSMQGRAKELEDFPVLIFYIDGADKKILVDTGGGVPDSPSQMKFHGPYSRLPEEAPDQALKRCAGVDASEIDIVILTHLHWDHCCNNHLFSQAEFYVQRKEILEAIDPAPRFRGTYEAFSLETIPPWAQQATKWRFTDGETEVADGVQLIPLPGHSKGMQGVLVETRRGPCLIASDALPLYDNCRDDRLIPNGIYLNLDEYSQTFETIRRLGATIIPGHDPEVLCNKSYPA